MKIFESTRKLRYVSSPGERHFNCYGVHCQLEKLLVDDNDIKTPYTFMFNRNAADRSVTALVRTIQPVGLPGEVSSDLDFTEGQRVSFLVSLHTSKSVGDSKSVGITNEREQILKLLNISEKNGFDVEDASVVSDHSMYIKKGFRDGFWLAGCTMSVDATVIDRAAFETAYAEGIGSKKSFGFGLIMLMPTKD